MKRVFTLSILILFISLCTGSISAGTTKLLSYNIKGHSMTSSRLADIATIINTQNPDIVALQEVDNRSLGIFNHDYLSELAEILRQNGLSALHGKVIRLSLSLATSMLSLLIGQW